MYEPTERTQVRRQPARGFHDRELVHAVLDEALMCHVGFVDGGQPYVIPTIHARDGDTLYFHGATGSRMLAVLAGGAPCSVTVSILDGVVFARSVFHHSLNYRSVVALGQAAEVTDSDRKLRALETIVEHIAPGRWREARPPSRQELRATSVLALDLREVSAKVRTGQPIDSPADLELPVWAGELPLRLTPSAPRADDGASALPLPPSVDGWRRA
jgi:nitroimidazol reductase NimA-like FMN-containing flavoprotein (pyridoxamine 5'-phosphate oxidase superfamily)